MSTLGFFEYTSLSAAQLVELEQALTSSDVKALLCSFLVQGSSGCKEGSRLAQVLTDFHFYNYAFCKQSAFSSRQTCCFMSIMSHVFESDAASASATADSSYVAFERLLLKHSVERPPMSIQVFGQDEAAAILDHVVNSYYRSFLLYRYLFSVRLVRSVVQVLPHEVEYATPRLHALDAGFFVPP